MGTGSIPCGVQVVRFTFSPSVADEVLNRLLELNEQRYEAEVAAGLHERAKKPKQARSGTIAWVRGRCWEANNDRARLRRLRTRALGVCELSLSLGSLRI